MSRALYLSPMIPSFNLEVTGAFFTEVIGFSKTYSSDWYRIFELDGLTVHVMRAGEDIGQMEFYLEVDDVDAVWESIKDKVTGLKVREPFNQEYGMRELHVGVPETNALMFIGTSSV